MTNGMSTVSLFHNDQGFQYKEPYDLVQSCVTWEVDVYEIIWQYFTWCIVILHVQRTLWNVIKGMNTESPLQSDQEWVQQNFFKVTKGMNTVSPLPNDHRYEYSEPFAKWTKVWVWWALSKVNKDMNTVSPLENDQRYEYSKPFSKWPKVWI